jgi:hypothetical protein
MDGGQAWTAEAWLLAATAAGLAGGWWLGRRGKAAAAAPQIQPVLQEPAAVKSPAAPPQPAAAVAVEAPTALVVEQAIGEPELTAAEAPLFDQPVDLLAQMEVLRRTEQAAESERDDLLAERDTLSRQLNEQRQRLGVQLSQIAELKVQLQRASEGQAAIEGRLSELLPLPQALSAAQAQLAGLEQRLAATAQENRTLHSDLRSAEQRMAETQGRLVRLEAELELAVTTEQLRAAEAEAQAEKLRNSEATEQLQALQEAHSGLQKQVLTLHGATHRARKLALQLREAQAAVAAARSLVGADAQAPAVDLAPAQEALPVSQVAGLVATWAAQPGVHAVAVADGRGLMVAGQGEEAQALAARASSLFRAVQQKSGWSGGLTLGSADVLQIRDRNGLSLLIKPWQAPGGVLLLAVLARDGVETQPWAADLLHRAHSVFVWSNPLARDKKVPVPVAPQPSAQPERLTSV